MSEGSNRLAKIPHLAVIALPLHLSARIYILQRTCSLRILGVYLSGPSSYQVNHTGSKAVPSGPLAKRTYPCTCTPDRLFNYLRPTTAKFRHLGGPKQPQTHKLQISASIILVPGGTYGVIRLYMHNGRVSTSQVYSRTCLILQATYAITITRGMSM